MFYLKPPRHISTKSRRHGPEMRLPVFTRYRTLPLRGCRSVGHRLPGRPIKIWPDIRTALAAGGADKARLNVEPHAPAAQPRAFWGAGPCRGLAPRTVRWGGVCAQASNYLSICFLSFAFSSASSPRLVTRRVTYLR
jgi:hypothetical protein